MAQSVDESLVLSASQVVASLDVIDGQINLADSLAEHQAAALELRERGITFRILDATGAALESFGFPQDISLGPEILSPVLEQQPIFMTVSGYEKPDPFRTFSVPVVERGKTAGIVQLARNLDPTTETLNRLATALVVGGLFLVILAAFGGYFLAARALSPIDRITRTARQISGGDLSARLNLATTDDEVGRLATTFDEMLERLDESFERERQFTADASHELRTPLAAMQAILGVIRAKQRTPEDYEQALTDLAEETDRLQSLVENLLLLARGDTRQHMNTDMINLSELVGDVSDSLRPLAETRDLTLICTIPNALTVLGDRDGLIRLFVNLIDNAIKHTERGTITVTAQANGEHILVSISDTGSGISKEQMPFIFKRFYRVDSSRGSGGAGLGLAIALEIARAHGGTIQARSTPGAGSEFTVQLPGPI